MLNKLRTQLEKTQILFWNQNNIEDVKKKYADLLFFVNSLKSKCNNSDRFFKLLLSLRIGHAYLYTLTDLTPLQKEIDKETSLLIDQIIEISLSSINGKIDHSKTSNYSKTFKNTTNKLFPIVDNKDPNFILFSQLYLIKGINLQGIIKKYNIPLHKLEEFGDILVGCLMSSALNIYNS